MHLDTGIMSGQDIVAAIAHGARFTLVGRAYLYGLMAGGRPGVDRAIEILQGQIERTMRLLGVRSLDELEPGHVSALRRLVARRSYLGPGDAGHALRCVGEARQTTRYAVAPPSCDARTRTPPDHKP